jgi:F0F1-type ATP synthase membrane subunit b/b'
MPITEELNNIKTLESVGFDHKQAEALTSIIERAQVNGQENLKEFIRNENKDICNEISNLRNEINNLRNEFKVDIATSSKDLLIKIFGIIVGTVGVAVTILKLFP